MNPISSTGRLFRGRFVEQCRDRRARKSTLVALVGRLFLSAADTETVFFFPVVCDDAGHQAQTGSGRLGAKGLLHTG
jgi:hypothetical protein